VKSNAIRRPQICAGIKKCDAEQDARDAKTERRLQPIRRSKWAMPGVRDWAAFEEAGGTRFADGLNTKSVRSAAALPDPMNRCGSFAGAIAHQRFG
jgi:hypothetical protein